jgi:hypothetical protein
MAINWPAGVPDCPLREGYRYQPPDEILRSNTDSGRPKKRLFRRGQPGAGSMVIVMTADQYASFLTWFRTTAGSGIEAVNFTEMTSQEPGLLEFVGGQEPFRVSWRGGVVEVGITFEFTPTLV